MNKPPYRQTDISVNEEYKKSNEKLDLLFIKPVARYSRNYKIKDGRPVQYNKKVFPYKSPLLCLEDLEGVS